MDTFSHALWGKGLFGYRKYRWFSLLFGAIPDLLSFGLYFLFNLIFIGKAISNPANAPITVVLVVEGTKQGEGGQTEGSQIE